MPLGSVRFSEQRRYQHDCWYLVSEKYPNSTAEAIGYCYCYVEWAWLQGILEFLFQCGQFTVQVVDLDLQTLQIKIFTEIFPMLFTSSAKKPWDSISLR